MLTSPEIDQLEQLAVNAVGDLRRMHEGYADLEYTLEVMRHDYETLRVRSQAATRELQAIDKILSDAEMQRWPDHQTLGKIRGLLHG